jgi:hypothetical protein
MRKIICSITMLFTLALVVNATEGYYENKDFKIKTLYAEGSLMPLAMALTPKDGFASNINVMIQNFEGSIEEYATISEKQFKKINFTVLNKKVNGNSLIYEYTGEMGGRKLHWYAKGVKRGNKVYLITGTAMEDAWSEEADKLKECVNSFKLK